MTDAAVARFLLVTGDPFNRLQRAVGLVPREGLSVGRRALFFALAAWLPLVGWAVVTRRAFPGAVPEPLLQHFGIHARCLLAIPIFIVAEGLVERVLADQLQYLVSSGVVTERVRPEFERVLAACGRLRDSWLVWGLILGIAVASAINTSAGSRHAVEWAETGGTAALGFGGLWARFVARPMFVLLLVAWLWRLILTGILFFRLARLDLSIVPTHPDRAGGLGTLEYIPMAFSLIAFAVSTIIASQLAHEIAYHGATLHDIRVPIIILCVVLLVLILAPLLPFLKPLGRSRMRAIHDYGTLVGRHGRGVRAKWIVGAGPVDTELLGAEELGPVIDTVSMYDVVMAMRPTPIGKRAIITVALAVLLPMVPIVAMEIPLKEVLLKLLGALV